MSRWVAKEALPARPRPDAAIAARHRIEQGAVLVEIERRGVWVQVATAEGHRFWVDGRRLQALPDDGRSEPGPLPPPPPPAPPPSASTVSPPARRVRRRLSLPVLAVGVVALAGLAALGFLLLRDGTAPDAPTVVRGRVRLGFSPRSIGLDIPRNSSFYLSDGETLTRVELGDGEITATSQIAPGLAQVETLSGVGFRFAAMTSDARVLVLASFSAAVESEVALPVPDCCADVLVGTDNGFFLFPEENGRSDSYLEYHDTQGSWLEHPLPAPITVTGAAFFDGFLYIGHTGGLLAVSPYDGCGDAIMLWDRPTAALAVTHPDDVDPGIGALDIEGRAVASIDPGTTAYHTLGDCRDVEPPRVERVVSLGDLSTDLQATLAMIGTTVYVIDGSGTVFIADVATGGADLVREIRLPGGPGSGASLIAVPDWLVNRWSVFVADPAGAQLWWITTGGPESPQADIEPVWVRQP